MRGFTLLELLVVLVIAAGIAVIALPRFANAIAAVELKGATRQVASALRYARTQAVAKRREVALRFDVEQRTFINTDADKVHTLPGDLRLKLLTAESEIVSEDVGAIRFFADGSSTGGRVTLSTGARAYEVDVSWLTGRVTVYD
jgi:general secretion pathway protein H